VKYIYKFLGGELDCELYYEPAERGSRERGTGLQLEPDFPERTNLEIAKINGVEITELLSQRIIEIIEENALKEMKE